MATRYTIEEAERREAERPKDNCSHREGVQCFPWERLGGAGCLTCGWCRPVEMLRKEAIRAKLRGGNKRKTEE